MKLNSLITGILTLAILSVFALAIPSLPTTWWGAVTINGSEASEGTVTAYINGTASVTTSITQGLYAIDVPCVSGDKIVLKIFNTVASGEIDCSPGDIFNLNLSVEISQCSDGTYDNICSVNKPQYCDNGTLVNRCDLCGCPSGQDCGSDNSCFVPED